MRTYFFKAQTIFKKPLEEIFQFFSQAENLGTITPPHLQFHILTPLPIEMKQGARIEYRLKIYHLPLHWVTEITLWDPPYRFIDVQLKGPYRRWIHEHKFFEEIEGGTRMMDLVEYAVPGGIFSPVIHQLFVRRDIEKIFSYRQQKCQKLFLNQ